VKICAISKIRFEEKHFLRQNKHEEKISFLAVKTDTYCCINVEL
jgi:hypothetical protein